MPPAAGSAVIIRHVGRMMRYTRSPLQIDGVVWVVTRVTMNKAPGGTHDAYDAIEFEAADQVRRVRLPWTRMPSADQFLAMTPDELGSMLRRAGR